jgi:dTDP-4-dehydrorhamnose reductase
MRKILIFGKDGQIGWEAQRTFSTLGNVIALGREDCDLSDCKRLRELLDNIKPELIVNASGYNSVDRAETERDLCRTINRDAPGIMAEHAKRFGSVLIHFSSDYVFDGNTTFDYQEGDNPNPLNYYGLTKLESEKLITSTCKTFFIFRTAWVYSLRKDTFVRKILHWARNNQILKVVDDQVGSPTWARMLAEAISQVMAKSFIMGNDWLIENSGLYHLTNSGSASRFDWAKAILSFDPYKNEHKFQLMQAVKSVEFQTPAQRPLKTTLCCKKFMDIFGLSIPEWKISLSQAFDL